VGALLSEVSVGATKNSLVVGQQRLCYLSSVPRIFEKDGYIFFFDSNDHEPIHVHVRKGNGEAVFLRESEGLKVAELAKAESLAEANRQLIVRSWHEHFDRP
jgi:hypothetical protein